MTEAELQTWLDGELEAPERARVSRHLEECAACRRTLGELRAASETFSAAMLRYDEDLADAPLPAAPPRHAAASAWPRWLGRAAAILLLMGGAAAAAIVPGSPLRALFSGPKPPAVQAPPPAAESPLTVVEPGASITVRPDEGRLTVRVTGFASGTRVRLRLVDGPAAVASLPDGAANARFVVASGALEVVGTETAASKGGPLELQLPRSLVTGVVEIDGKVVARVTDGRLVTLRQVSRAGDEAVLEVGG